jgi:hypothetical protein
MDLPTVTGLLMLTDLAMSNVLNSANISNSISGFTVLASSGFAVGTDLLLSSSSSAWTG